MNARIRPPNTHPPAGPPLSTAEGQPTPSSSDTTPAVVAEAEAYLRRKRMQWGISLGTFTLAFLGIIGPLALGEPLFWGSMAATGASLFVPPGFRTLWAKRVVRRWEDVKLDESLPTPEGERDERLQLADLMAHRICTSSALDADAQAHVHRILDHVHRAVRDSHIATMLDEVGSAGAVSSRASADKRIEKHLRALDELHQAIIDYEETETGRDRAHLSDALSRLLAEGEVEKLLSSRTPPAV